MINNLIRSKGLTQDQRKKINVLLYNSYEGWAVKKAFDFKYFHNFKCKNIDIDDLILSSKVGLYKATQRYNANSSFSYYSELHIKNELFATLTKHFSFSKIPSYFRRKRKNNFTKIEVNNYMNLLHPEFISYTEYWKFDSFKEDIDDIPVIFMKEEEQKEKIIRIWKEVDKFEPFSKKIFLLRYDRSFNILRTSKEIALMLDYTPSHIRTTLSRSNKRLADILRV